ncbi:flagellar biosynthesis anti-sigma factor FlgM [Paenisporosarcina cavernae]|uniref:Negative regulator of flagellin synthesis n=1 Tax=Paenisporosarcina cavernae TaxID=2320858 RepID=A0A385YQB4_9BACL|nr:flagellar biosynthesis anti-sigma factor FlgM [Paenisporosarcina cavernae]AYC28939.1 flagellar biosynthesis anti-sigma factor FlgM [Paenisporosarcina cavernae]
MKINQVGVNAVNPYKKQSQKVEAAEAKQKFASDKLEISSVAKEMQTSVYSAERAEKIAKLKESIDAGTYQVDANKLAADLVNFYKE